jgi:ribosomal protein S18 acetylase RimI-like enzyme
VNIDIREATEADLPSILDLYAQPEIDDGAVLNAEAAENLFRRIKSYPSYCLYVACSEQQIVGSFALLIMDNLGHMGAPSGIIEDVVVDPARHRNGIGTAMMRYAMDKCRSDGCYKVVLSANSKRQNAHLFYESLGFYRHGYSYVVDL